MRYLFALDRNFYRKIYAKDVEGLSKPRKEAYFFQKYLEEIPLHIEENELFAGWYGYKDTWPEEAETFAKEVAARQREHYEDMVKNRHTRWVLNEEYCWNAAGYDRGHNLLDYKTMIERGTRAYIADVDVQLATAEKGSDREEYLLAMKESLVAGEIFSNRYARLAEELAKKAETVEGKRRLERIAKTCKKVPMEPAEDFYEALQSAYFLWSLNCISDDSWCSVSFGSFDQFMYPYYVASQKANTCSDKEVEDLLVELYKKLDWYGGQDCALSVGGLDKNGKDATNALSYLIVSAEKRSKLRSPLLAARINKDTPKALMDALVCKELFEIGQPTFYSEECCKKAVMARGISAEEASKYQISTCMQMEFPGAQVNASWGCVVNLHLPLELALNQGVPLRGPLPMGLKTAPKKDYQAVEEIYDQYKLYFRELFAYLVEWNLSDTRVGRLSEPNPWLSAMTQDCIAKGCDRWDGGATYHDVTVESFAFANGADAISAIEKLVFQEKKYTIQQFVDAAKCNYKGYEKMRKDILQCPKYGMNHKEADDKAYRLISILAEICSEHRQENIRFLPSLHTLHNDVFRGAQLPAMMDGRLAGTPVNKNAGPANIARGAGPTAMVLSACRLDQSRLNGGQALDIHFAIPNMDMPEKRDKVAAFIKTYLAVGGLQMQVNALSADTLKKAYDNPADYKDLIVRIGGHSRYFNDLEEAVKKEFIERISIEEGVG